VLETALGGDVHFCRVLEVSTRAVSVYRLKRVRVASGTATTSDAVTMRERRKY
jgi:hypothetical protein